MDIREAIARLVERQDLTARKPRGDGSVMRGEATPAQIGGFSSPCG